MGYHDVVFPEEFSTGSALGPGYRTLIVQTGSGAEYRSGRAERPVYRYDIAKAIQPDSDIATLVSFFHARKGALYSFKLWDLYDHSTSSDHTTAPVSGDTLTTIGTGTGSATTYQLLKVYTDGTGTTSVPVTKPKSGTVVVKVNGVLQVEGVDYTVDTTSGIVTMTSAPTAGHAVVAGCQYYQHVRFDEQADQWFRLDGDQVYANVRSIPIIGVRDSVEGPEMFDSGGAEQAAMTGHVSLTSSDGRVQSFDPDANGYEIRLYDPANAYRGGPHFLIQNESGTYSVTVKDSTNALTVATLAAGEACEVWCRWTGTVRRWVAI